jgi:hypothetical protein
MGRKYYFVQLSTGASQWDTPTQAAPTGPTPQATPQGAEHPYGTPAQQDGERGLGVGHMLVRGEVHADDGCRRLRCSSCLGPGRHRAMEVEVGWLVWRGSC